MRDATEVEMLLASTERKGARREAWNGNVTTARIDTIGAKGDGLLYDEVFREGEDT